jgi:hypothetical protein
MSRIFLFILMSSLLFSCREKKTSSVKPVALVSKDSMPDFKKIQDIPAPTGYKRVPAAGGSFAHWLRHLGIKKDKTVFLFNGKPKPVQTAQFAVIDKSRSITDLQQCADVVIRLRAEYLFDEGKYDSIQFMDFENRWYKWKEGNNRAKFKNYLDLVFGWCGSASLEKQLTHVQDFTEIKSGDVLVKGGFPGHAMIVADMAINTDGEKIFMLIQGYQPAQDMHIVINPLDNKLSPWYTLPEGREIITPEWKFYTNQLKKW